MLWEQNHSERDETVFVYPQREESGMMESQAPQWCYEEAGMHCWLIVGTGISKCGHFMVPVVSEKPDVTLESSLKWSVYRKNSRIECDLLIESLSERLRFI